MKPSCEYYEYNEYDHESIKNPQSIHELRFFNIKKGHLLGNYNGKKENM